MDESWPPNKSGPALANYFFFVFCVNADAATDFASLLAFGSCRIFEALAATALLVTSFFDLDCVSAEAATDFSAALADLLCSTFDAADATFLPVLSDFAMCLSIECINAQPVSRMR